MTCEKADRDMPVSYTHLNDVERRLVINRRIKDGMTKRQAKKELEKVEISRMAVSYTHLPNYDPRVGAEGNHTYDSGDGRGVDLSLIHI